jgi:uncharacterized protein involved in outer membrane biogenesis
VAKLGAAPGAPDLLSLDRAFANLEWLRIVRGELALAELTLEKPVFSLVRAPDGYIELPAPPPAASPSRRRRPMRSRRNRCRSRSIRSRSATPSCTSSTARADPT